MDEGPLVALVLGANARLQDHVVGLALLALLGCSLHGPPVWALHAQALPGAAGISAPAALGLLQALGTRLQARTVLSWRREKDCVIFLTGKFCCFVAVLVASIPKLFNLPRVKVFYQPHLSISFFIAAFIYQSPWDFQLLQKSGSRRILCCRKLNPAGCRSQDYFVGFWPIWRSLSVISYPLQEPQIKALRCSLYCDTKWLSSELSGQQIWEPIRG